MQTACWMADTYSFRPEFRNSIASHPESMGFGMDIQPLDAPEYISAGGTYKQESLDGSFFYDLPIGVWRQTR